MQPHLAASIESLLIFVALVLLSAASSWIQRRRAARQEALETEQRRSVEPSAAPERHRALAPMPPPRPVRRTVEQRPAPPEPKPAPTAEKRFDWEAELRRLLEGEPSSSPTPEPTPSPMIPGAPPPLPPAPTTSVEPPARLERVRCGYCGAHFHIPPVMEGGFVECPNCSRAHQIPRGFRPASARETEAASMPRVRPSESSAPYVQPGRKQEPAGGHFAKTPVQAVHPHQPAAVQPFPVAAQETVEIKALLRTPRTCRQVFAASVIFGAPKALER